MEVINAIIKNVSVGLDDLDHLSARMTFEFQHGCCDWAFGLADSIDSQRLVKLMNYAGEYDVAKLNGKIVRVVNHERFFRGFGDPILDKFVPAFGEELKEVTEAQFEEVLKNI